MGDDRCPPAVPRPQSPTTVDMAQRGRSPETWRPSLDANDRSVMKAVLAHKSDPRNYPVPLLREGMFVSWSGNWVPEMRPPLQPLPQTQGDSRPVALAESTANAKARSPSPSRG